jgi:hypothetical protein
MMLTACVKLRAQVPLGVKIRTYLGAAVSAADGLSDGYMIRQFYEMGKRATANGLLVMVGTNLAFQLFVVWVQHHRLKKNKWKTMLWEALSVVTLVKPGVDAHRVASGAERVPGASLSPLSEMMYTKAGELVFEAIPG